MIPEGAALGVPAPIEKKSWERDRINSCKQKASQ